MLIFDDIFTRGDVAPELSISESPPSSNSSSRSLRSYPESLHKPIIFHRAHSMSNNKPNYQPTPYPNTYPRVDHLQDLKVVMGMAKTWVPSYESFRNVSNCFRCGMGLLRWL
ncbi:hypothetical protein NC653_023080 [Populus alba x Populus x berolinensis]|uniref:Uncharacterized protein n=1 Tax=Populus alba x Populus x berolinensis TaxID=444605 RepID=A0AAD6MGM4_9ROSI|nr:hypothetical protein NC653_023080 [Populus alba x Populus x berolinensis]